MPPNTMLRVQAAERRVAIRATEASDQPPGQAFVTVTRRMAVAFHC